MLLALSVCDAPVSLYGFWPFCCHPHRGWPAMDYKYSQGNRTRFVCCSTGRERMEREFAFYERLQRDGLVSVHARAPTARQRRKRRREDAAGEEAAATDLSL